jgi:hypothetical protein
MDEGARRVKDRWYRDLMPISLVRGLKLLRITEFHLRQGLELLF